jgi:hypothetical protein
MAGLPRTGDGLRQRSTGERLDRIRRRLDGCAVLVGLNLVLSFADLHLVWRIHESIP